MQTKKYRIIEGARQLRKNMTRAESKLWKYLSGRGLCGYKFRRQYPIDKFIIDFYCAGSKLGIEIDGKIHNERKEQDVERETALSYHGIKIIRFANDEVSSDIENVLKTIIRYLTPSPLCGEGESRRSGGRG